MRSASAYAALIAAISGPIPRMAESIVRVDGWIGEILDKIEELGIADNTIVMVMGDNGPFMQYREFSGQNDRIYRGGKTDHLEGGVRVNAFLRWPSVIEGGTRVQDIVHITDLYTTLARVAGSDQHIPRDRLIDGVDQTPLIFIGDSHGRRDYVYIYEGPVLRSIVKQQFKFHLPAPGANPIAPIFDLYKDSREERTDTAKTIPLGVGFGGPFVGMLKRHIGWKQKYPDREQGHDIPYGGIENLRPETQALVEGFKMQKQLMQKCQRRSKIGPPGRRKIGPLSCWEFVHVVHGRGPRAARSAPSWADGGPPPRVGGSGGPT